MREQRSHSSKDRCYFEVYVDPKVAIPYANKANSVERSVIFEGKVNPPKEIEWSEINNGISITYKCVLKLSSYMYYQNETTAFYKGSLSAK